MRRELMMDGVVGGVQWLVCPKLVNQCVRPTFCAWHTSIS